MMVTYRARLSDTESNVDLMTLHRKATSFSTSCGAIWGSETSNQPYQYYCSNLCRSCDITCANLGGYHSTLPYFSSCTLPISMLALSWHSQVYVALRDARRASTTVRGVFRKNVISSTLFVWRLDGDRRTMTTGSGAAIEANILYKKMSNGLSSCVLP